MDDKIGFYGKLLWVDDEIEMLRAQIYFLEKKGYEIVKASNGTDAIDICSQTSFDLILLDENMPGLSGLETLQRIKEIQPEVPIVMVTKSEEEDIMNQAIGSKIADYLIKPVNPNQILLSLKKKHPQEGNRHRSHTDLLPSGICKIGHADKRQPFMGRMDRRIQTACLLGTGTGRGRQRNERDAQNAETGSQQPF